MIIYRAKYKKECLTNEHAEVIKRLARDDDYLYLFKHEYVINAKDGKKYEYHMLNSGYCVDISELEFIEECPKIDRTQ